MSFPKYQAILGSFVAITILLALILWAIIAFNDDEAERETFNIDSPVAQIAEPVEKN